MSRTHMQVQHPCNNPTCALGTNTLSQRHAMEQRFAGKPGATACLAYTPFGASPLRRVHLACGGAANSTHCRCLGTDQFLGAPSLALSSF